MLSWLKSLIPTPKVILGKVIDSLDYLVPLMAARMDTIRESFNAMDSRQKSQWVIDEVQAFLRKRFRLDA